MHKNTKNVCTIASLNQPHSGGPLSPFHPLLITPPFPSFHNPLSIIPSQYNLIRTATYFLSLLFLLLFLSLPFHFCQHLCLHYLITQTHPHIQKGGEVEKERHTKWKSVRYLQRRALHKEVNLLTLISTSLACPAQPNKVSSLY